MKKMIVVITSGALLSLSLASCGQKGGLYLPSATMAIDLGALLHQRLLLANLPT